MKDSQMELVVHDYNIVFIKLEEAVNSDVNDQLSEIQQVINDIDELSDFLADDEPLCVQLMAVA